MGENVILYGDIVIEGFESFKINKLEIVHELNNHAHAEVYVTVAEDDRDSIENLNISKIIRINAKGELVYSGLVSSVRVEKYQDVYEVYVTSVSHSYMMDIEKKSMSFQDKNMTYKELIGTIAAKYPGTRFMDKVTEGKKIGHPIIQYKETDWEFLKRMASHFNSNLVVNVLDDCVQFYFGLPEIDKGEFYSFNYTIHKDLDTYKARKLETPVTMLEFISYEADTTDIYDLGDKVNFENMPVYISKSTYRYDKGVINNTCRLSHKGGTSKPHIPNYNIAGCSIFGRVIATARDVVKVHLEIDQGQEIGRAYWYPYASMYASQDETGWYCMPEIGDTIRLYHPEADESRAMAISSVKPHNPKEDVEKLDPEHRMANTNVKYLRTAFGKEVKFRPDGIDIIAKDGTVFISLNDDGTMNMNSNNKISFTAMNDIEIKSKNINVEATDHIAILARGSSLDLEDDIVVKGKEVKTN